MGKSGFRLRGAAGSRRAVARAPAQGLAQQATLALQLTRLAEQARKAAEVVALRQATPHPGLHRFFQGATWLWAGIFLLLTAGLAVLMVTEPTATFLMLSTVATVGLTVAGIGASVLWFVSIMRKHGLRVRFTPA